ncbi:hypothetical protein Tco_1013728 [Tanacetum coccineum]
MFKNVTVDSEGSSISKTQCLDSSITSQGLNNHLFAFLGHLGFETNRGEFFFQGTGLLFKFMGIAFHSDLEIENFDGATLITKEFRKVMGKFWKDEVIWLLYAREHGGMLGLTGPGAHLYWSWPRLYPSGDWHCQKDAIYKLHNDILHREHEESNPM